MGRTKQTREADWRDWIDPNNQHQVAWAIRYLRKKGLRYRAPGRGVDLLSRDLQLPPFESQMEHDRFIDLMKKAWKAKKVRDKTREDGESKPLHIVLSQKALDALDTMSQRLKQSKKHYLEKLILDASKLSDLRAFAPKAMTNTQPAGTGHIGRYLDESLLKKQSPSPTAAELGDKLDRLQEEFNQLKAVFIQGLSTLTRDN